MVQSKNKRAALPPESATDEPGSSSNRAGPGESAFASEAERAAYRAGLAAGARGARPDSAGFDFDPVATRYRIDGLTPEKQREYVEALADSGVARYAAARINVSEQAINRLRRRADARPFNLACEAGQRIGARRLHSIAYERAIEGTIRRHYYHGELTSEERVFDNRLLVYLLGKTEHLLDDGKETRAVAENWQPWMDAMEQGLPPPEIMPKPCRHEEEEEEREFHGAEVWETEGRWWTEFPPPEGFDGIEEGSGEEYRRSLTPAEQAVIDADNEEEAAEELDLQSARRDRYFGFDEGGAEEEVFSPREAELYETSDPGAPILTAEAGEKAPPIAEPVGEEDKGPT